MVKKIFPHIIIFLSVLLAGASLFSPGLFPTHDGEYHIIRFYEFSKVLHSGILYPRWAPDLNMGYGVPLFNFVYPLPNFVAFFLNLFSISFINGFKISLFVALLVGAYGMYLWAKEFWGKTGGLIASVCYTFSPYHFVDIYIRGSIGEVYALCFYPWFLYAVTKYKKQKDIKWLLLSNIALSLIIFSHNILALAFMPVALCFTFFLFFDKKNILKTFARVLETFILGIGISAIFWLPAIIETRYTVGLQVFGIDTNFPDLFQLLLPSWGSGFFGTDLQNQMSVQIGIANLIACVIGFIAAIKLFFKKDKNFIIVPLFLFLFFSTFLLMLPVSLPIWKIVPLMNYFQFPWRFLSLTILITSFLAGSIIVISRNVFLSTLFILLIVVLSYQYAKPAYFMLRNDQYYTSRANFIDGTSSPGNAFNTVYFQGSFVKQKEKIVVSNGDGIVQNKKYFSQKYLFSILCTNNCILSIHTAYFPGWKAAIDSKEALLKKAPDGSMLLAVDKGMHSVIVWFGNTEVVLLSIIISFFSWMLVLTLSLKNWYSKRK